jgi:hypothetical protein
MTKSEKGLSFEESELTILRNAVDKIENIEGTKMVRNPDVQKMIQIVEDFIRKKELICYGGTAINNILPEHDQFYNKNTDIPDYDFFTTRPLEDAKQLADIFGRAGYTEVEAKAGAHYGTFKVFVNFVGIADITMLVPEIFNAIKKESIRIDGILYTPPDYLRMSMYLELSRPKGDVSRWEKVLKRLTLLNKYYPLRGVKCDSQEVQRKMSDPNVDTEGLFIALRKILVNEGAVFFGSMAITVIKNTTGKRKKIPHIPDFDILSKEPKRLATIVREKLKRYGLEDVKIIKRTGIGEIISPHYEITVYGDTILMIYEPMACHSYNVVNYKNMKIRIATIDTMLSFYLAFLYSKRPYYEPDRIVCLATDLFEIQKHHRLSQKGLLKRFSLTCIGKQETLEDMRSHKSETFKKLANKKGTKEYNMYFLKYVPNTAATEYLNHKAKTRKRGRKKHKKTKKYSK